MAMLNNQRVYIYIHLVGGFKHSEKYVKSVTVGVMKFPICGKCMIYVVIDMYNCIIYNIS